MSLSVQLYKLRTGTGLSQEKFAASIGVSRQAVQKWESGTAVPDLDNLIRIAQKYNISIDTLTLNIDSRYTDEPVFEKKILPQYSSINSGELYSSNLTIEYTQSVEEGKDIKSYEELFRAVSMMPIGEEKERIADVLYDIIMNAPEREDYEYIEPSKLEEIRKCSPGGNLGVGTPDEDKLPEKLHGAWLGRICGCLLGKPVEGMRTNVLVPLLKESGNYPMHRYIVSSDITDEFREKYNPRIKSDSLADKVDGMPPDDDTNYMVLAYKLIKKYGTGFTPMDMSRHWLAMQPKDAYWTAERIAFCNFIKGYAPPDSAICKNPFREWIGAQIRGDYFGYICPGNPETAAELAWRDASISHVKNGIYGEMWASAMIAAAAVEDDIPTIIKAGMAQIPEKSRLTEALYGIIGMYESGKTKEECFAYIHEKWDEYSAHGWCHTISNAMVVAAALLYGGGDYGKSICMAVETGFDTDCNGATVGSVLGMRNGAASIGEEWIKPVGDTLHTTIFGMTSVKISDMVKETLDAVLR